MKTSIVIATYNKLEYTQECIKSIRSYTEFGSYEIIVVDNHSTDGSVEWLKQQEDILLIINHDNLGFPKACNQGIEASTGDNVLLLNNDTIVTNDWLMNMVTALYSAPDIGAVSTVTNNCSNHQSIRVDYETLEEMQLFAEDYNVSDSSKWEERARLIGYNLLIKKKVLLEVGLLDELFTPGNYEDDDLCIRIRLAGYRLLLCKDTFIHHFGSMSFKTDIDAYRELLNRNQAKFASKWGFAPEVLAALDYNIIELLTARKEEEVRILEVGCGCGTNFIEIKNRFSNAKLFGLENNPNAAQVAATHAIINNSDVFERTFDYILLNECSPLTAEEEIQTYKRMLSDYGEIIIKAPNLLSYTVLQNIINDRLSIERYRSFSPQELLGIINSSAFPQYEIIKVPSVGTVDNGYVEKIIALSDFKDKEVHMISQFIVKLQNYSLTDDIKRSINQLLLQIDIPYYSKRLLSQQAEQVIQVIIEQDESQVIQLLNYVGMCILEVSSTREALPYLNKAFEMDPVNSTTLLNLGIAMYLDQNYELALEWLGLITEKNATINEWIRRITQETNHSKNDRGLQFLVHRIEFELDYADSLNQLISHFIDHEYSTEEIVTLIENNSVNKPSVINKISIHCHEINKMELVIPLLQKSLELDPKKIETLRFMGKVLFEMNEFNLAYEVLSQLATKDDEVKVMIAAAKEAMGR
ncbi:hypothetical protein J53TS2_10120 [Paenibacillus sp. J53TS2]|uniref:glycosyltransferase n=1 Tax=Paenibacillus sp. J53TS2 TaxID=2807197 RepID=UPI001B2CAE59|nr:glycosyltransferase [Paenibacillus sp. J53TS2]GIP47421.1 hypothetical protein J53TS2_10120 [Paenibacillus sp. J53TS2]